MTDRLTDTEIADALALCERATKGPWPTRRFDVRYMARAANGEGVISCGNNDEANARFAGAARLLLPRALAELQAARRVVEAAREAHALREAAYGSYIFPDAGDRADEIEQRINAALAEYDGGSESDSGAHGPTRSPRNKRNGSQHEPPL